MTVPSPEYLDPRLTEQRNPRTQRIDVAATLEIVDLINAEDATVAQARAQTIGAATGLLSCSDPPKLLAETCDVLILPRVGPEALTGSTRMKAGTATKLVLNTISTGAMIRLGRAYGNLMVDLMAWSDQLRDRGEGIVVEWRW